MTTPKPSHDHTKAGKSVFGPLDHTPETVCLCTMLKHTVTIDHVQQTFKNGYKMYF